MTLATTDSLLRGIGCNMNANASSELFPEECIAELSTLVLQDLKALILLNSAIQNNKNILHPEMLLKCLKQRSADLNVIGALLSKTQDRRFEKVIGFCHKFRKKSVPHSRILSLSAQIGQCPYDKNFEKFGIMISDLIAEDSRKITNSQRLLRGSVFFKNRVLFGCNWRADIISCIQLGFKNPSEIKRRLQCSYETAHRVFNDYMLFQEAYSRT